MKIMSVSTLNAEQILHEMFIQRVYLYWPVI